MNVQAKPNVKTPKQVKKKTRWKKRLVIIQTRATILTAYRKRFIRLYLSYASLPHYLCLYKDKRIEHSLRKN